MHSRYDGSMIRQGWHALQSLWQAVSLSSRCPIWFSVHIDMYFSRTAFQMHSHYDGNMTGQDWHGLQSLWQAASLSSWCSVWFAVHTDMCFSWRAC